MAEKDEDLEAAVVEDAEADAVAAADAVEAADEASEISNPGSERSTRNGFRNKYSKTELQIWRAELTRQAQQFSAVSRVYIETNRKTLHCIVYNVDFSAN